MTTFRGQRGWRREVPQFLGGRENCGNWEQKESSGVKKKVKSRRKLKDTRGFLKHRRDGERPVSRDLRRLTGTRGSGKAIRPLLERNSTGGGGEYTAISRERKRGVVPLSCTKTLFAP